MSDTATAEAPVTPLQTINRRAPYAASGFLAASAALDTPEPHEDEVAQEEVGGTESPTETEAVETTEQVADDPIFEEAAQHGFSKEQAEKFGDSLPQVLAAMDRQASLLMREQLQKGNVQQPQEPVAQPEKVEQQATLPPVEKFEWKPDPDEYTEKQIADLSKLTEHINKQADRDAQQQKLIEALAHLAVANHGDLSSVKAQTQTESDTAREREWDGVFTGLGDDFKDVYGKDPVRSLPNNSQQLAARNKLVEEAHLLQLADQQAGRPQRSTQDYATRAMRLLHQDKIVAQTRQKVEQQVTNQRRQGIARPSGRSGKPGSGDDRAKNVIAEYLERMKN